MRLFEIFKKSCVGLGLAVGLWQSAVALPGVGYYTGTYIVKAGDAAGTEDSGSLSVTIASDGTATCKAVSAKGYGSFSSTGKAKQAYDITGKPLEGRMSFLCLYQSFPGYMTMDGDNKEVRSLTGLLTLRSSAATPTMLGKYTIYLSNDGGGEPSNQVALNPQAISGEWYDPAFNGSGFNFLVASNGFFAHYYGRTTAGEMLWLVTTEVPTGTLKTNTKYTLVFGNTTSGTYAKPTPDVGHWGQLDITFTTCTTATATLTGKDGVQTLNLQRLAAIAGVAGCGS